jgi:hypothetical protein
VFIDYAVVSDCINPGSYGEICVKCNACGRFNKETQKECALNLYRELLQEAKEFNNWIEGREETQRKNKDSNIKYFTEKIRELESS